MATLLRVSRQVLAEKSLEGLLQRITDVARELSGARLGIAVHGYREGRFLTRTSSHDEDASPGPPGGVFAVQRGGVYMELVQGRHSVRLTGEELERHPAWWGLPRGHRPLRGLLGASLADANGQTSGLVMVSDREEGDFTEEDEALLVQLAAIASLGLQHIEARREVERRVQEVEELARLGQLRAAELQSVLDNMVEGVFVCDAAGRLTMANRAGVRMAEAKGLQEMVAKMGAVPGALEVRRPDGRRQRPEEQPMVRALGGETVTDEEWVIRSPVTGREGYHRTSAAPIRDAEGGIAGAIMVSRDVTDLTELDRQKDQFIAVAAHELKTPLAILKSHAQALIRKAGDVPPERRKLVDAIERGVDRADGIVNDLLDLSRLQTGQIDLRAETFDLAALLSDMVDRMALTTDRHELRVSAAGPLQVTADRGRIEQAIAALLDNAIRYSPKGGTIGVRARAEGCEAVVSVADPGVGIPEGKQEHIFERFYRAHTGTPHDYGGMGVALYIAHEVVSRHGGRMWFDSAEEKGSTFCFSLPLNGADD